MKNNVNKITKFIKQHLGITLGACCGIVVLIVVIVALSAGGGSSEKWGKGITNDIPLPDGIKATSVNVSETHAAAYFEDVSSDEVNEYIALVEEKCGVAFESQKFPRSTSFNDKLIVVHYNVTEKKLSITVAAKGDNEVISGESE